MKQIITFLNPVGDARKVLLLGLAIVVLLLGVVDLQHGSHHHKDHSHSTNYGH